jgi:hypothetical protein
MFYSILTRHGEQVRMPVQQFLLLGLVTRDPNSAPLP